MKRILFIIAMLLGATCYGQNIPDNSFVFVDFDYSKATLDGVAGNVYLRLHKDFVEEKVEAEARFIQILNKDFSKGAEIYIKSHYPSRKEAEKKMVPNLYFFPDSDDAAYKLVVVPKTIDDDGDFKGDVYLMTMEGEEILHFDGLKAKGGRWGSFANLMGDGYEDLAGTVRVILIRSLCRDKEE